MHHSRLPGTQRAALVVVLCATAQFLFSQDSRSPKISTFAPADDLVGQVDFYIERVEESLADPADYDGAKQSRTWKDSNTLAVLALMLARHDAEHPLKSSMPAMLKGAQALAAAEDDVKRAQQALSAIKAARAGTAAGGEGVKWEKVAALAALMKQVPLVHAGLRRGVTPNRLRRLAKESAGQAATLSAIAEAAMLDDQYAKTPEKAAAWSAFCGQMRDAAGEVNSAVHAQDQPRVDAGIKRLLESCDACHAEFRKQ
ncbi:MAG: hypothetical protein WD063_11100 [Pirellulales bacterium]